MRRAGALLVVALVLGPLAGCAGNATEAPVAPQEAPRLVFEERREYKVTLHLQREAEENASGAIILTEGFVEAYPVLRQAFDNLTVDDYFATRIPDSDARRFLIFFRGVTNGAGSPWVVREVDSGPPFRLALGSPFGGGVSDLVRGRLRLVPAGDAEGPSIPFTPTELDASGEFRVLAFALTQPADAAGARVAEMPKTHALDLERALAKRWKDAAPDGPVVSLAGKRWVARVELDEDLPEVTTTGSEGGELSFALVMVRPATSNATHLVRITPADLDDEKSPLAFLGDAAAAPELPTSLSLEEGTAARAANLLLRRFTALNPPFGVPLAVEMPDGRALELSVKFPESTPAAKEERVRVELVPASRNATRALVLTEEDLREGSPLRTLWKVRARDHGPGTDWNPRAARDVLALRWKTAFGDEPEAFVVVLRGEILEARFRFAPTG